MHREIHIRESLERIRDERIDIRCLLKLISQRIRRIVHLFMILTRLGILLQDGFDLYQRLHHIRGVTGGIREFFPHSGSINGSAVLQSFLQFLLHPA